jgi:hypothetical protein
MSAIGPDCALAPGSSATPTPEKNSLVLRGQAIRAFLVSAWGGAVSSGGGPG